jgi:hypothetical protein
MKPLDPIAWQLFQRFTLELIERGFTHYSSDAALRELAARLAACLIALYGAAHADYPTTIKVPCRDMVMVEYS